MNVDAANLGYLFHPFASGSSGARPSLGYAELEVFLSAARVGVGFVPAHLVLCVWTNGGGRNQALSLNKLTITPHAVSSADYAVAPGFITIAGHGGSEVQVYCFGGALACRKQDDLLVCRLISPAPLLNLSEEGLEWSENAVMHVVDGLESEIATYRARYGEAEEAAFDRRLAATDPRLLYAVGLALAQHSFAVRPELLRTEHYWDEHSSLMRAIEGARLAGWWPAEATLPAVLASEPTAGAGGK